MKKEFDFFEFTGVILPGLMVLLFLIFSIPSLKTIASDDKLGLGEFGILILLSYVVGHLMQAITNLWEIPFWSMQGGMPTEWLRKAKQNLISAEQVGLVEEGVRTQLNTPLVGGIKSASKQAWKDLTRQMYAVVRASDANARVDAFNGNYGLMRGTVTAGAIIIAMAFLLGVDHRKVILGWAIPLMSLAAYRMYRFGLLYARELFAQFVQIGLSKEGKASSGTS